MKVILFLLLSTTLSGCGSYFYVNTNVSWIDVSPVAKAALKVNQAMGCHPAFADESRPEAGVNKFSPRPYEAETEYYYINRCVKVNKPR